MPLKSVSSPTHISDQLLRAIAILGVVLIHFLAMFRQSPYVENSPFQLTAVTLDQLFRVSVPLFVALSGYGLSQKYVKSTLRWGEFLRRRVWKLLPLYIGWSVFYYLILRLVPSWRPTWPTNSLLTQILLGQADYQMYFVPMIFQLYLLFPFLLIIRKRWPLLLFISAAVLQAAVYLIFMRQEPLQIGGILFVDQNQYILCLSWIFYFVLGMYLPQLHNLLKRLPLLFWILLGATLFSGAWAVTTAVGNINQGIDPLVALRFTRFSIMAYASVSILILTWLARGITKIPSFISFAGKHSYSIYLSHTLFLRILFSFGPFK